MLRKYPTAEHWNRVQFSDEVHFDWGLQLQEDPKQQDKLTTWIEYLYFEYWWLDRYTRAIQRHRPEHDEAWQKLVDTKAVDPNETPELIRTEESALQRAVTSLDAAQERISEAHANIGTITTLMQLDPCGLRIPASEQTRMLSAFTEELHSAQRALRSLEPLHSKIVDFLDRTSAFGKAMGTMPCRPFAANGH